jgi:hypothetical protein
MAPPNKALEAEVRAAEQADAGADEVREGEPTSTRTSPSTTCSPAEHGPRAGDLGAVVELYGDVGVEVEFVRASGHPMALVTLRASDLRVTAE